MIEKKYRKLQDILIDCRRVLVAFSGGVDSTLLLAAAAKSLPPKDVLAVTARSATSTAAEIEETRQLAQLLGVSHLIVDTEEMAEPDFVFNHPQRCYFCKHLRYSQLKKIAEDRFIPWVLDGSNIDDMSDFRPGSRAVRELAVRTPLQEVGFNKAEIRELSRQMGLPVWDKPSSPCLATRVPYGHKITVEKLNRIEKAESYLKLLGFSPVRVRHYEAEARIEVDQCQFHKFANRAKDINIALREMGFLQVNLDLAGFKSGSMNKLIRR